MTSQPAFLVPAACKTCSPWVRAWETPSGELVRQELHEETCTVFPKFSRRDLAATYESKETP